MTGKAVRGCIFVFAVDMTGGTGDTFVAPYQRESRQAVVKVDILPVRWVMAFGTVHPHLSLMHIHVTGGTGSRCIFEGQVFMALRTCHIHMFAQQGEASRGMVKGDILPGGCRMTGGAIGSQFTNMRVILFVAREAV